jgi:leader peptidase (prepilin peptidase) / N-methyltransferase
MFTINPASARAVSSRMASQPAPRATSDRAASGRTISDCALLAATIALPVASWAVGVTAAIVGYLLCVLAMIAAIDLRARIVPNRLVLPATAAVVLTRTAFQTAGTPRYLLAGVLTAFVLLAPNLLNSSAMGMGDVKLGLLLGCSLGTAALGVLIIAFLTSFPVALVLLLQGRNRSYPFAPFIAVGAVITVVAVPLVGGSL